MSAAGNLVVEKLRAGYGGAPILEDISFVLKPGEAVAVWGRNGAGKTTLLRALSGLLKAQSGRVVFDGDDITKFPPHAIVRRGVAHVPEGRRVIPGMTVVDNLKLGGFILRGDLLNQRLAFIYKLFPRLLDWGKRKAGSLSGGEQQLLAICRAMMADPKLLLLDEPLTGLAPVIQHQVLDGLKRIRENDVGILIVEQNVHQSLRIVERGIVLEQGRISLEGTAGELIGDERILEGYLGQPIQGEMISVTETEPAR